MMQDSKPKQTSLPDPIWSPTEQDVAGTNIARWCAAQGLANYRALHDWSTRCREEFWVAAVERLGIRFTVFPQTVLENRQDPAHAMWFPDAQLNIVESCFQSMPDDTAIVSQQPGRPLLRTSFQELRNQVAQIANSLREAGFEPGDRIAVVLPMIRIAVPVYLGIVAAGCQVVSIADSFAAPEIATRLRIAEARAAITCDWILRAGKRLPLYARVREAVDSLSNSIPVFVTPWEDSLAVDLKSPDASLFSLLVDDFRFRPVVAPANTPINILFSSGTTGEPKAIPWTHLTPIRSAVDGYVHQDIQAGHVVAWPTNLGWMMGPWLIFASLINRASVALFEDAPTTTGFGQFVQDAQVTMLGVVPTIVKAWRSSRIMDDFDWSAIRCFSSTGESSQVDDMTWLSARAGGKPIIEYCGGTEIGGAYITSTLAQPNVPAAFSTPSIGLDFVILDDQGTPGDEGELLLIPPSIGLSNTLLNRDHDETYYRHAPHLADGPILRQHGDYFRRIGDYYIAGGRADDTMNLGGIKVSSAEVERALNLLEGVRETAAIAVNREGGPDRLVVFAVLEQPLEPDELLVAMNRQLKQQLNPLFRVAEVAITDALPRTASNKVMRRTLRDQYLHRASQ